MTNRKSVPPFTGGQLERLAQALGETHGGLTGSEIGHALRQARIADVDPNNTKWKRLYNALVERQNRSRRGDCILNFIHHALEPARYVGAEDTFESRREEVNNVLAFNGLQFSAEGKFVRVQQARTLTEAQRRANELRTKLRERDVHADVLEFCKAELLEDNYFHAVLEATKSIASKLRKQSGLDLDGAALVDATLSGSAPRLQINPLQTASERSEQTGFVHLVKGLFGTFRNPTAHEPRIAWQMLEEDALDLLVTASYVHRRLDKAISLRLV